MKTYIKILVCTALLIIVGCSKAPEGPGEKAGKALDRAGEKAGKAIGKAIDNTEDAIREAGKELKKD